MRCVIIIVSLAVVGLLAVGSGQVEARPANGPAIGHMYEALHFVQVRMRCPKGSYIAADGRCHRLPVSSECRPGYFLDYDGRCKRTRRNLRLLE